MLQLIRDRAQGVVVWVIIIIIILAFALVGVNSYLSDDAEAFVAKVNGEEISLRDFQRTFQQERAFRQQLFGDNTDSPLLKEDVIKREAMNRLISAKLTAQTVVDAGFSVSNQQLNARIRAIPQFQSDDQFDVQLYARLLSSQGLSQKRFEDSLKRDMLTTQFMSGVMDTEWYSDFELDRLLALQNQQRRIGYMQLKQSAFDKEVEVSDAEVEDFYNANLSQFAVPEQVSIEYLELSMADLVSDGPVDDEVLREMYQDRAADFVVDEERRASHILIKTSDSVSDEQAKATADDLLQRINKGESFSQLAKEFSEDAGSAALGGDLDYFAKGLMVPSFEEAAFAMKTGEVSEPVKSPYGYHIIKLTDIRAGHGESFEDVRDQLLQQYRDEKAEEIFYETADLLTNLTFENADTLTVAAEELELEIKSSDYFNSGFGLGISSDARVRDAAFSIDVLEAGNNSEIISLSDSRLIVLRIKDRKPVTHRELSVVSEQIKRQLGESKRADIAQQKGLDIIEQIKSGEKPEKLAKQNMLDWNITGFINRNDSSVDASILSLAFALSPPQEGESSVKGLSIAGGDYAVVMLYDVQSGNVETVANEERDQLRESSARGIGQHVAASILDALKQRAEIKEYPDRIQ